jgi:hypothetical protein
MGYNAHIWPMGQRPIWKFYKILYKKREMVLSEDYPVSVVGPRSIRETDVVVYPEITAGNPLGLSRVVRWFLHKPGYHTGVVDYGKHELYFFFDSHSNDASINPNLDNKLSIVSLNTLYVNKGLNRCGSCYLMRKGQDRKIVHNLEGSIKIDGLSHKEISDIFNRTKTFYSYDEMTMYSQYAALCGCNSVVIPESYDSREEWVKQHPIGKYGVAYGFDDIDHAVQTQHKVKEFFEEQEQLSLCEIIRFVEKIKTFFNIQKD